MNRHILKQEKLTDNNLKRYSQTAKKYIRETLQLPLLFLVTKRNITGKYLRYINKFPVLSKLYLACLTFSLQLNQKYVIRIVSTLLIFCGNNTQ